MDVAIVELTNPPVTLTLFHNSQNTNAGITFPQLMTGQQTENSRPHCLLLLGDHDLIIDHGHREPSQVETYIRIRL